MTRSSILFRMSAMRCLFLLAPPTCCGVVPLPESMKRFGKNESPPPPQFERKALSENQKKSSRSLAMELSTPTKIIDVHADIIGVSYTTVRDYGECAIVTTPSELFMYSTHDKNVPATWVFPSNSQECLTSVVYSTDEKSKLMACQGGSTFLQWNTSDISVKDFKRYELKEPSLAFFPIHGCILNLSKSFNCTIYTSAMEELISESIPVPDEIIRIVTRQLSSSACLMYMLLRYNTQYKAVLVEGSFDPKASMRVSILPIPVEENNKPIDILFSSSACVFSFFFSNGSLRQFALRKSASEEYSLQFEQSIPLLTSALPASKRARTDSPANSSTANSSDSAVVTWRPWLTEVSDKAFAFVRFAQGGWRLTVLQGEYLNELCSVPIAGEPCAVAAGKSTLAVAVGKTVSVASFQRSTLTLAAILRSGARGKTSAAHHVQSRVTTGGSLLRGLEVGVLNEPEWQARRPETDANEEEEEKVLETPDFEQAALAFIARRVEENSGVISLRNEFLVQMTECCVRGTPVVSSVLRALLRNHVDIAVNPRVLPRLMETNDLTTLLLYLVHAPMLPEANLLKVLLYFLQLSEGKVRSFAKAYGWDAAEKDKDKEEKEEKEKPLLRFVLLAGRFVLRVNAKSGALRQCMRELGVESVYRVCLFLTTMLANLDQPCKEEELFLAHHGLRDGRLYISSLVEWLNCLLDVSEAHIALDAKKDSRFPSLLNFLGILVRKDMMLYANLIPLGGMLWHLEQKLAMPLTPSAQYAIERLVL